MCATALYFAIFATAGRVRGQSADVGACGPPPPPKPANVSAAEGLPPLPLPVVPQRRTEQKKPPRPPVIAVKIVTGTPHDWATDPNDLNNLLVWMKSKLGVNFTHDEKRLEQVDLEASDVPVLYRTGHNAFAFNASQRARLRAYLLRGGMIIFDACCGRRAFADSARREIAQILHDHELKPIGLDHPIFNCYYQNAGWVRFTPHSLVEDPNLTSPGLSGIEGIEIACRLAVVFSPHDLSCGWDMHTHSLPGTTYIHSDNALKIGANFMAYATAMRDMRVSLAESKAYVDAEPTRADKFRVGQVIHEGDWNPDPVGLRNLLDTVGQGTALKISFDTEPVRLEPAALSRYPFVYMTGHGSFAWTDAQVAALRQYLLNGGFLFADACCGRQKFDAAFREQMAHVLRPAQTGPVLAPLPASHPLFAIQHQITAVQFTDAAVAQYANRIGSRPRLESAAVGGRTAVIYSPIALNVGWRLKRVPYAIAYEPRSALELGVNVVMYAISQ